MLLWLALADRARDPLHGRALPAGNLVAAIRPRGTDVYSLLLLALGRGTEAAREMDIALEVDPVSLIVNRERARVDYIMGNSEQALRQLRRTMEMDPSFSNALIWIARSQIALGRYREAIETLRHLQDYQGGHVSGVLGYALARAGERQQAEAILVEMEARSRREAVWPMFMAIVHETLGRRDVAARLLEEDYRRRSPYMIYIRVDPLLADLRTHPRVAALIERLDFPD